MAEVAVVTGGAGGMGLATAALLAHAKHVVLSDLDAVALESAAQRLRAEGAEVTTFPCDLTQRSHVQALAALAAKLGRVSSVVHTAGVSPQMGGPERMIRVNAVGTVHVVEAFYPVAHEEFALVNVASVAGHMIPQFAAPTRVYRLASVDIERFARELIARCQRGAPHARSGKAYALSKNFVLWYSKDVAARFGEKGGRVLSVSPGSFDTPMGRLEKTSGSEALVEYAALKRFGRPEEVAELLAFCAGSKPGYLTATDILCDGGTMAALGLRQKLAIAWSARKNAGRT